MYFTHLCHCLNFKIPTPQLHKANEDVLNLSKKDILIEQNIFLPNI